MRFAVAPCKGSKEVRTCTHTTSYHLSEAVLGKGCEALSGDVIGQLVKCCASGLPVWLGVEMH
jgi:hypothetical protein